MCSLFGKCLCFDFLAITAISCVGAVFTTVFTTNTFLLAPRAERGAWRHDRGRLGGARLYAFVTRAVSPRGHGPEASRV